MWTINSMEFTFYRFNLRSVITELNSIRTYTRLIFGEFELSGPELSRHLENART